MTEINIDYDTDILENIDGFGKWQKILFALLWIPSAFSAMPVFMYSFIAYEPKNFWCNVPQCSEEDSTAFLNFTAPSDDPHCQKYK